MGMRTNHLRLLAVGVVLLSIVACTDPGPKMSDAARDQGRSQAIAQQAAAVLPAAQAQADANAAALKAAQDTLAAAKAAGEADAAKLAAMQALVVRAQADAAEARAKADDIAAIRAAATVRAAADAAEIQRLKDAEAARQAKDASNIQTGTGAAGAVLPFVPAPYGELAGLVLGVAGGIGAWIGRQRAEKFRTIAEAIPAAIERAQTDAGIVNFDDPATRALLKASIGPEAHAMVSRVIDRTNAETGARAAVASS